MKLSEEIPEKTLNYKRIFDNDNQESFGEVFAVDTATVVVRVSDIEKLRRLQVNRLVWLQSSKPGEYLIGIVQKIVRSVRGDREIDPTDEYESEEIDSDETLNDDIDNTVRIALIGTHIDVRGRKRNMFVRTLETVPEIDAKCFAIEGDILTHFMGIISSVAEEGQRLDLGVYTLDDKAVAYLNGNKFFQRHALIVGTTGSGKSWTIARIVEQVAKLSNANAIVFDLHGEYSPLAEEGLTCLRVAGPGDLDTGYGLEKGVLHLPFWMLGYEAMLSIFVDRTDQNAPNQTRCMSNAIQTAKCKYLQSKNHPDVLANFTIDSPIPFDINAVFGDLKDLDEQKVPGARSGSEKQGPYFGKLSRLIDRLENKRTDRRLGFLFQGPDETMEYEWLNQLAAVLIGSSQVQHNFDNQVQGNRASGVKIVDFSDVPSDILPLIVSLVARLAFSVKQWMPDTQNYPIALFCDEAHLYISEKTRGSAAHEISTGIFERIAKEGRKHGVGLVVISQRPSEVNRTVLSQCNNFVSMRLTNAEDQNIVRRLLPDSLEGFTNQLAVLDTGESLVVGDASLLPSRIRVSEPTVKPASSTIDFWDKWADQKAVANIEAAVAGWRKQSRQ